MPRFEQFQPLYSVFQSFLEHCIRNDRSLIFSDQQVWTLENLKELKNRFIDHPVDDPNIPFNEKLRQQIGEQQSVIWALVADLYFIFYLTSKNTTTAMKVRKTQQFSDYITFPFPPQNERLWDALNTGLCNAGVFYNQKYRQFTLMILFFIRLKEQDHLEQVLENPEKIKTLLDPIIKETSAYDMRSSLLYLAFPDQFDPIISQRHKIQIIEAFTADIPDELPDDHDQAILIIRDHIQNSMDSLPDPFHFYNEPIYSKWSDPPNPPPPPPQPAPSQPLIIKMKEALRYNKNLILYGPPGSGKTYLASQFADDIVKDQLEQKPRQLLYQQIVANITVHELIALSIYQQDPQGQFSVPEIKEFPLIQTRFRINPITNPNQALWGALQQHANPESENIQYNRRVGQTLFDRKEEPKWYLMDEGREYVQSALQEYIELLASETSPSLKSDYITHITFHQSFSYEEFIEGLRPITGTGNNEGMVIDVVPGVFKDICARAASASEKQFVLVIDEINRGDISRIFGELITLIENDKRAGAANHIFVKLPYSKEDFSIPANLIIIGTMNTADRSIALLDTALRRRFAFIEVPADPELLDGKTVTDGNKTIDLKDLLELLNHKIRTSLCKDHHIGHSYLLQVANLSEEARLPALTYTWNYQILPLLEEYFYSQPDRLHEILPDFFEADDESEIRTSPNLARYDEDQIIIILDEFIQKGRAH
jgi:5-methylcytosine-specific restriction protein B